ncbi:MAG: AI-2E family transporter, partial [Mailhella sp.]|nr:AI-2E family transporter [Mailhella sp.]
TVLTAICLNILDVKAIALLCTLVFMCGLIPVLGVFISSVPIVLMAINSGGIELGLWAVVMIIVIHLIEAYVLNPRIVSSVMHINPVMTLIILYIAHSVMGMWGMLLGVPIAVYIYRKISKSVEKAPKRSVTPRRRIRSHARPCARTNSCRGRMVKQELPEEQPSGVKDLLMRVSSRRKTRKDS